jgi:seryl-tRNA synthetase
MLSIQLFRQEKELVLAGLQKKNFSNTALVDSIIEVDELRRTAQQENDALAAIVNAASKEIGALMG